MFLVCLFLNHILSLSKENCNPKKQTSCGIFVCFFEGLLSRSANGASPCGRLAFFEKISVFPLSKAFGCAIIKTTKKGDEKKMRFADFLFYLVLFTALLAPGYILGKIGRLEEHAMKSMTNLLTDVALPFLVLSNLLKTDFSSVGATELLVCILFPLFLSLVLIPVTAFFFRGKEEGTARVCRFCAIFPNCGFLGIPLAAALFPDDPRPVLFLSLFNVFSTLIFLTLGISLLSGDRRHTDLRRAIFKPITVAVVLGVLLSVTGIGSRFPFIDVFASYPAALTTPLAMTVLGFSLSRMKLREMVTTRELYSTSLVKLVLCPLLALAALFLIELLPGVTLDSSLVVAMLIASGVSSAASAPALVETYGEKPQLAAILTLGTTLLCVATLPLLSLLADLLF